MHDKNVETRLSKSGGGNIHNTVSILLNVYCHHLCLPSVYLTLYQEWKEGMERKDWDGWERDGERGG